MAPFTVIEDPERHRYHLIVPSGRPCRVSADDGGRDKVDEEVHQTTDTGRSFSSGGGGSPGTVTDNRNGTVHVTPCVPVVPTTTASVGAGILRIPSAHPDPDWKECTNGAQTSVAHEESVSFGTHRAHHWSATSKCDDERRKVDKRRG